MSSEAKRALGTVGFPIIIVLPLNCVLSVLRKVFVASCEMTVAEKAAKGTQGTWMRAAQYQMFGFIYQRSLTTCGRTPQEEHHIFALARNGADNGIRKYFPTLSAVTESLMCTHREAGVQEEHALLCPTRQVATCGDGSSRLCLHLLHNIAQRWRKGDSVLHREAKSMRLPHIVVRVLPQNHNAHIRQRCLPKGIENKPPWRKTCACGIFATHVFHQGAEIFFLKFGGKDCAPRRFDVYFHFIKHLPVISAG